MDTPPLPIIQLLPVHDQLGAGVEGGAPYAPATFTDNVLIFSHT